MKIRTDVIKMYKEVHGWVGIISGLALFIAFYAGALTMFEEPLQRWASPPAVVAATPLNRTDELIGKVLAAHPEAAKGYDVNLLTDAGRPARVSWSPRPPRGEDHGPRVTYYAALAPDGALQVTTKGPSAVGQFIDVLHQQVGLPFKHEVAMPIMGAISLLYFIALVSGTVVLLPSLVSDLFALRVGRNVKRMWLDVHNVLGLFSLPFHIIMALTAVVFAFHDQFYDAQGAAFPTPPREERRTPSPPAGEALPAVAIAAAVRQQAPGFEPITVSFSRSPERGLSARVGGLDARYGLRGPTAGFAGVDPYSGRIKDRDYMPGLQDGWSATITSFFALHFGNFGGEPIRWSYFLLGLAGAFLFYTGNLLWVESRRKKERKAGLPEQTRATRVLGALTVGVPLGCIAGISATLAAAKLLGGAATTGLHSAIYYVVFVGFTGWALLRGAARSGVELSIGAAAATLLIPTASLVAGAAWYAPGGGTKIVDTSAIVVAGLLMLAMQSARRRAYRGARDSVWSSALPA